MVTCPRSRRLHWNAGAHGSGLGPRAWAPAPDATLRRPARRRFLYGLTAGAAAIGLLITAAIVWRVADGAWPAIKEFHLAFIWHNEWNPVVEQVRCARPDHRHRRNLVRRRPARSAGVDRDRPVPERARTAVDPRPDRHADRDARCCAERRDRPLGHLRAGAVRRAASAAVPRECPRVDTPLRGTAATRSSRPSSRRCSS